MKARTLGNLLLVAAVGASLCACKPKFTYEVSPAVIPAVLEIPAPDGGTSKVEAYADEKGIQSDFVADEVVITPSSDEQLEQFLSDYGGTVIGDNSVPDPPAFLNEKVRVPQDGFLPTAFTVRVTQFPDTADFARDAARRGLRGNYLFSSDAAVKLLALTSRESSRGLKLHPNFVFVGHAMLHSTQEQPLSGGGFDNAMNYFAFHGPDTSGSSRSSIYKAWQFMEAAGWAMPQWYGLAILDGGFWLNAAGAPMQGTAGIGTDLPGQIVQYDFHEDDYIADGGNPNNCTGGNPCPWHGNNTASVAAGFLDNQAAVAGSGGQVSQPFLFKLRLTSDQQDRAIRTAIAWGAEVVNMSFGGACNADCMLYKINSGLLVHMQQAFEAGIILVASAGNDAIDVSANNVLPCCLPGVICVGALENWKNKAIDYSNYGAGVDIWADTNIPAMPNGGSPNALTTAGGTSASSPLVAGVAAMMKTIDPALNSDGVRNILQNTAYKIGALESTDPKVKPTGYMDAWRAVMAAADNKIFDDAFEPNNAAGQATPLNPGHYDELTLNPGQWDYYAFSLADYGSISFDLEYMTPMGFIFFNMLPQNPDALLGGVSKSSHGTGYHYSASVVPPGDYKLLLSAYNPHYYFMNFTKSEGGLAPDQFEPNNTFAVPTYLLQTAGSWDLTLHQKNASDVDYFMVEMPQQAVFLRRQIRIADADAPVKVDVLDPATQNVIATHTGTEIELTFADPAGTRYVLKVYNAYTRYVLEVRTTNTLPQWEELLYDPFWWLHPVGPESINILREVEDWVAFTAPQRGADVITLTAQGLGVSLYEDGLELLQNGAPLLAESPTNAAGERKVGETLDTSELVAGNTYLLRVFRTAEPQNEELAGVDSVRENVPYTLQCAFAK